ncbi:hypothetical protein ACFX2I_024401 [Malus domestica]
MELSLASKLLVTWLTTNWESLKISIRLTPRCSAKYKPARRVSYSASLFDALNKQLHKLAHNYATNMKRKIDQMQESDGQILLDHQRFVGLFHQHLPSSSGAVLYSEAPNDQPPIPPPSVAPPIANVPPTTETSPKQLL